MLNFVLYVLNSLLLFAVIALSHLAVAAARR